MSNLGEAIEKAGTTPCDAFACARKYHCAESLLACDAFRWYVKTGRAVSPFTRLEKAGKTTEIEVIDATREKYQQMMADEV